uniref:Leucine carboxyl methyltransferase 1 n=1 Tax=Trypanosoma brucei brucei (strain 927/4 GUTat10.1) TaxID=185431 RepID=Q4FKQ2_TRYB2|nr:leucine carboxyl methyltransferase, putative [Trypanosoma brucei brucei TREU927]
MCHIVVTIGCGSRGGEVIQGSNSCFPQMALQQTAYSACSRRVHCVSKTYLNDPFASCFVMDSTVMNSPLMNRGTWLRTEAIERSLLHFARGQCGEVGLQVISFGSGMDTLYFRLKKDQPDIHIAKYIELDFPDLVARKRRVIDDTEALTRYTGPEYELVACDLRKTDEMRELLKKSALNNAPTVILAEMIFVYLEERVSSTLLTLTLSDVLDKDTSALLIAYDAIRPDDRFGEVMVNNLKAMGVMLRGIHELPTVEAHAERCRKVGLPHVISKSMKQLYLEVPQSTQKWLCKLEIVDDWDEWCIMLDHYCFVLASNKPDAVPTSLWT